MSRIEYVVTRRGSRWYVGDGDESHGPYLSRRDALADAIDAAEDAGRRRHAAVVLIKEREDLTVAWTYGEDPTPG